MEVFQFYQDQKVTAWDRVHFSVTAANFEEAKAKLEAYKDKTIEYDDELSIEISHCEYLSETSEQMSIEDNGGFSTLEMFTREGDEVMDNAVEPEIKTTFHCSKCGSTSIQKQAWVDPNNNNSFINCDDEEGWCSSCEQHLKIIPHSELMKDLESWWQHIDNGEDREVITGLVTGDYDTSNDYQAFDEACNAIWAVKTDDQKVEIWRTLTHREYDNN